MKDSSEGIQ